MVTTRTLAMRDTWDQRLIYGFAVPGVPEEVRVLLVAALGALGCEAEYGVALLHEPVNQPRPTRALGEHWLRQCGQLAQRLIHVSAEVQVAAQSYLGALAGLGHTAPSRPAATTDKWGARFDATPGVWWPEQGAIALEREPIEFWLRRAGFAYRHAVTMGLPEHIEALDQMMALVLHALQTLPPGGVLTREALAISLMTLTTDLEGDLVPHHLRDLDDRHVGLITAIATLMRLTPLKGASLKGDLAWARGERERLRLTLEPPPEFVGPTTRPLARSTGQLWARQILTEWDTTIAHLETLLAAP